MAGAAQPLGISRAGRTADQRSAMGLIGDLLGDAAGDLVILVEGARRHRDGPGPDGNQAVPPDVGLQAADNANVSPEDVGNRAPELRLGQPAHRTLRPGSGIDLLSLGAIGKRQPGKQQSGPAAAAASEEPSRHGCAPADGSAEARPDASGMTKAGTPKKLISDEIAVWRPVSGSRKPSANSSSACRMPGQETPERLAPFCVICSIER